jgi:hypothetical protein
MSTATSIKNKATALARVQALIAGTKKHFPSGTFTFGGTTYTTASLVQAFQSLADAIPAVNAVEASAKNAVTGLQATDAKVAPLMRDYQSFLRLTFSTDAASLADFGLQPSKARTPLNSDKRAAAAAKSRATRKARGTTSKKQKLAVKGDVTGVIVTPVTNTGPSPSPPAAPAEHAPATTPAAAAPVPPPPAVH